MRFRAFWFFGVPAHILLDFFGNVVDYLPEGPAAGYRRSHGVAASLGSKFSYGEYVEEWVMQFGRFQDESDTSCEEFSMQQVSKAVLANAARHPPDPNEARMLAAAYLEDWNQAVVYPAGMSMLLRELASRFTLAIVSNTHDKDLVPTHLKNMGVDDCIAAVVTSVEVGRRKPHASVYGEALEKLAIEPSQAIFVGDTYSADYEGARGLRDCGLPDQPLRSSGRGTGSTDQFSVRDHDAASVAAPSGCAANSAELLVSSRTTRNTAEFVSLEEPAKRPRSHTTRG